MCQYFVSADPILYESRTRSIRIHGVLTSIRLENLMWDTLSHIAAEEGKSTNHLITTLHDEIQHSNGEVHNFASFLRVTCLRHFQRKQRMMEGNDNAQNAVPATASVLSIAGATTRPAELAQKAPGRNHVA
jgi:predicted DNA-binding ribbon-helix-helix protein